MPIKRIGRAKRITNLITGANNEARSRNHPERRKQLAGHVKIYRKNRIGKHALTRFM